MSNLPGIYGPRDNAGSIWDGDTEVEYLCPNCKFDGTFPAERTGHLLHVFCPECDWEKDGVEE